ncbi:hypothetical protein E3N88_21726 [Mikania micrantha]|uniref:Reverse transcriptase domain-containing protein n=1 Tax=Mikania micrantha TaxID=192012 RepID=A0A5N6NB03_9ASTR|nr:hypothetical protein E3N88_21726 [Mikania micrantha]
MKSQMDEILKNLQILNNGRERSPNSDNGVNNGHFDSEDSRLSRSHNRFSKVEFPKFDGTDVEGDIDEEEVINEEINEHVTDPHISLCAITGVPSYSTMKIVGAIEYLFKANLLVIPLSNYDIVLGIQWLQTLNDIVWNFKNLTMKFKVNKVTYELKGTKEVGVGLCSMEKMTKMLVTGENVVQAQLFSLQTAEGSHFQHENKVGDLHSDAQLESLLNSFQNIFEIPKGLPPSRSCDHRILLKDEKVNLNLKPYRYMGIQKTVIEDMTQELLDTGVIRNSTSSFAAPVVLVKKKDGSWRMCVDYRRLNEATVKDGFPIPLIEELFDELGGASVFSKLDLRSGYHQQHLVDLQEVLSIMRLNSLKAKRSKCTFGGNKVEYLGHVITREGVATDPNKIKVIQEWPVPSSVKQLRGFLGLAGYYRRFIKGFGGIAKPLTELLKKGGFLWSDVAQNAFLELKKALSAPPVLVLPDFTKTFGICSLNMLGLPHELGRLLTQLGNTSVVSSVDRFIRVVRNPSDLPSAEIKVHKGIREIMGMCDERIEAD